MRANMRAIIRAQRRGEKAEQDLKEKQDGDYEEE